jgi:hypothetical protein
MKTGDVNNHIAPLLPSGSETVRDQPTPKKFLAMQCFRIPKKCWLPTLKFAMPRLENRNLVVIKENLPEP